MKSSFGGDNNNLQFHENFDYDVVSTSSYLKGGYATLYHNDSKSWFKLTKKMQIIGIRIYGINTASNPYMHIGYQIQNNTNGVVHYTSAPMSVISLVGCNKFDVILGPDFGEFGVLTSKFDNRDFYLKIGVANTATFTGEIYFQIFYKSMA